MVKKNFYINYLPQINSVLDMPCGDFLWFHEIIKYKNIRYVGIDIVDELIEAIEEDTNKIHEAADVFYHLLIFLEANDVKIEDVMAELDKRKK